MTAIALSSSRKPDCPAGISLTLPVNINGDRFSKMEVSNVGLAISVLRQYW
jgi:hypothetical protein